MRTSAGESLAVGTVAAAPGLSMCGAIPAGDPAGGVEVEIPVVGINCAEPEGPLACALAVKEIDPEELRGAAFAKWSRGLGSEGVPCDGAKS